MSPIIGYAEPMIASPGDCVQVKISCSSPQYTSKLALSIHNALTTQFAHYHHSRYDVVSSVWDSPTFARSMRDDKFLSIGYAANQGGLSCLLSEPQYHCDALETGVLLPPRFDSVPGAADPITLFHCIKTSRIIAWLCLSHPSMQ